MSPRLRQSVVFVSALALSGCAGMSAIVAGAAGPTTQPCVVSLSDPAAVHDAYQDDRTASLQVGNDGGWCGWYERLTYQTEGAGAWDSSEIVQPPAHGMLRVRKGPAPGSNQGAEFDRVHIEYSAAPGYVGPDAFALRLGPGFSLRSATVTVVPSMPIAPASGVSMREAGVTSTIASPSQGVRGGSGRPGTSR